MGYHKKEIPKGTLGFFSKIQEEYAELEDANDQGKAILELCEMADLIGAIEAYVTHTYKISLGDLIDMMNLTKEAFRDGTRN